MIKFKARTVFVVLSLGLTTGMLSATTPMEPPTQDVRETRDVLKQWVDVERTISAEKRDWALGKELLQDRIEIVRDEIEALRGDIGEAQASITTADATRAELLAENAALKAASASLEELVVGLEARVRELLVKLPPPIVERVSVLSARMPKPGETSQASLGARYANLVGILNEVNKFNGEVSLYSELRQLEDGSSAQVAALYIGISQAFYVTNDQQFAGTGSGTSAGWEWLPDNASAPAIARAIAILENEAPAAFVHLPLQID